MSTATDNTTNPTGTALALQSTNERLNGLDPSVTGVVQGLGVLQGYIQKNERNTVTILNYKVATLDHIFISSKVDINQLSKAVNRISNSIQNLSHNIDGLSNSVDGLSNSMDRLSNSIDRASNSMDRLSNSVDRLSNSMDRVFNSVDGLQNLLKEVEEKGEKLDMTTEILSAHRWEPTE